MITGLKKVKKIMIVDDDPYIRRMVDHQINKNLGYKTVMVENGATAVRKATIDSLDLVLMDVMMPKMDGIAAVREIRKNPECTSMPIIMLSAEGDKARWVEAFEAGANDFVPKPFHKNELFARINTHLNAASLVYELSNKNAKLEKEKVLARIVQEKILSRHMNFSGFEMGTFYQPKDQIGGDFFDAWETSGTVNFLVGDVSGHGTASAFLMAACKGMFHSFGQTMHSPLKVVAMVNRILCDMLGESDMFLTLVYVSFERQRDEVQVLSAGHNPVFLLNGKNVQTIESTGPFLAFEPDSSWEVVRYPFKPGDSLFLYTDGLTEARNKKGEQFGKSRLYALLQESEAPKKQIKKIFQKVEGFCGSHFDDDLAMFAIKREW